ncbi:MAG: VacJ family lipoprotein [Proteobacteria bacterium]|nr:VacJ family lipoprotein [Pseudomonadota bacterium]
MIIRKFLSLGGLSTVVLLAVAFSFGAPATAWSAESNAKAPAVVSLETAQVKESQSMVSSEDVNDPLEPLNRVIFEFNEGLQDAFLRPITIFYNENVNLTVRQGVGNFLDNLSAPVVFANELLQGELERAMRTLVRAIINTTIGIGGLADAAGELGIEGQDEDFGQTLGVYGVGEGFYLVLPVFGPSNPRDAVGKFIVDGYFDLIGTALDNADENGLILSRTVLKGIDEYAGIVDELNQVKKTSVDYYAAVRSLYRQKRKTEILNGSTLELPPIPDLSYGLTPEDLGGQSLANVSQPAAQ